MLFIYDIDISYAGNHRMTRDIDISLLRTFVAVVETGSVTLAARLLNRTQAAVSLQIKRLEEQFGQELFRREHRALVLGPAGDRLLSSAQRLLKLNDEVWESMTTPAVEGEVRLGVPYDIVGTQIPPVLRRFNASWPRVQVTLVCKASKILLDELATGDVDLTLTTEVSCGKFGETLVSEPLVWVGAQNGKAQLTRPLPVSLGGQHCKFRPDVLRALRASGLDWRMVSESESMEAIYATLRADLAVAAILRSSVPDYLTALGPTSGLPRLSNFLVNLYLPPTGATATARELAGHIRREYAARYVEQPPSGTKPATLPSTARTRSRPKPRR